MTSTQVVPPGLTPNLEIVLAFIIKTSEVLGPSNLNFMKMSVLRTIILFNLDMAKRPVLRRSDRASINKTRGGGVLIALSPRIGSCKRRYDLEYCDECLWVEIFISDGLNLLLGNDYFPPDAKPEFIANYFRFLENKLDTQNFRVIMFHVFNTPGFD
jgi:hypothetical protein